MSDLDSADRFGDLRSTIQSKGLLRAFYDDTYARVAQVADHCPEGLLLEIGSGGGFLKEVIPEVITSDVVPYAGLDRVVDAQDLPFDDHTLGGIFLVHSFHHIPNVGRFFSEAVRCLVPGGRILIIDPIPGFISTPVNKYLHHEGWDRQGDWAFPSEGPLSSANQALAWKVFVRDQIRFKAAYPTLNLVRFERHTPLMYILSGGLKRWKLLPGRARSLAHAIDEGLMSVHPRFASFVDVELVGHPEL